jgi:hypothetical protein
VSVLQVSGSHPGSCTKDSSLRLSDSGTCFFWKGRSARYGLRERMRVTDGQAGVRAGWLCRGGRGGGGQRAGDTRRNPDNIGGGVIFPGGCQSFVCCRPARRFLTTKKYRVLSIFHLPNEEIAHSPILCPSSCPCSSLTRAALAWTSEEFRCLIPAVALKSLSCFA